MAKEKKLDFFGTLKPKQDEVEEIVKEKKIGPMDIVKMLFAKEPIADHLIESSTIYSQFMINRFLASTKNFKDFPYIEIVNELNCKKLTNRMHYDFLFEVLHKRTAVYPGYAWNKKDESITVEKTDMIAALKWKYRYDIRGAEIAIRVCTESELKEIHKEYVNYKKHVDI